MRRCVNQGEPHPDRAIWTRLTRWSDRVLSHRGRAVIVTTGGAILAGLIWQWIGKGHSFTSTFVPMLMAQAGVHLSEVWNAQKVQRIDRQQAA